MTGARLRLGAFVAVGLAIALALALLVSPRASSSPDGLERVAIDEGFDGQATDHHLADGPTADYAVRGVDHDALSTGLSGVIGVAVTFAVGAGVVVLMRRTRAGSGRDAASPTPGPA